LNDSLIGYAAAICTTVAFLPQAYTAIKHKNTHSLSLGMYIIFTFGVALWLYYGIQRSDWAIVAANGVTLILASLILITKLRCDVFGKGKE